MSSTDQVTSTTATSLDLITGRVKWFNNKAGYGFITVTDGVKSGSDVFVHHTAVNVDSQQYKYLVQGEYVQFQLVSTPNGNHEYQASHVSGINSGKLMCETSRELKISRGTHNDSEEIKERQPPKQARLHVRGEDSPSKEWTMVNNHDQKESSSRPRGRPRGTSKKTSENKE